MSPRGTLLLGVVITATAAGLTLGVAYAQPMPPEVEGGGFGRSRIGVQIQPMTSELREHFHAPPDRGLLVSRIDPDRPAARAGIQVGDILTGAAGEALAKPFDLLRVVNRVPEGDDLEIEALRDGKALTFHVQAEGQGMPWLDPNYWHEWAEKGMRRGSEEMHNQMQELDRRLKELERKLDEMQKGSGKEDGERT